MATGASMEAAAVPADARSPPPGCEKPEAVARSSPEEGTGGSPSSLPFGSPISDSACASRSSTSDCTHAVIVSSSSPSVTGLGSLRFVTGATAALSGDVDTSSSPIPLFR